MDCLELIQFQEQSGTHPVPGWLPKIKVVPHLWSLCFTPDLTIIRNCNLSSYQAHLHQVLSGI